MMSRIQNLFTCIVVTMAVSATATLAQDKQGKLPRPDDKAAQDKPSPPGPKPAASKVTSHSEGLHGYIGFGHEKLPPEGHYDAGMGFYAAV